MDDWLKQEEPGAGDGFGDDWESAFQEEDFDLDAGLGPEIESFLFSPGQSNPYQFTPPGEADLADIPDLHPEMGKAAHARRRPSPRAVPESTADPLTGNRQSFKKIFATLPRVLRLALAGILLGGLMILAISLLTPTDSRQPVQTGRQENELAGEPAPVVFPPATGQIESTRRKWDFMPFYVPVAVADSGEVALFLEVELALLLVLAPDEEIPHTQKIFIRELIYQFFRGQPLAMLRQYDLARGEMNRNLLAWLREQWPESLVETVIFNRYQLS